MSRRTAYVLAGAGVGVLALLLLPTWAALLVIAVVIGIPVAGYLMLDPTQRKRLNRATRRQLR